MVVRGKNHLIERGVPRPLGWAIAVARDGLGLVHQD